MSHLIVMAQTMAGEPLMKMNWNPSARRRKEREDDSDVTFDFAVLVAPPPVPPEEREDDSDVTFDLL